MIINNDNKYFFILIKNKILTNKIDIIVDIVDTD